MAYTLISMIGTGMYKTQTNFEGYKETDYHFESGQHFKTRLFMQALLQCRYKPINQIILLGTDTSSWDCLVDKDNDDSDETIALWDSLFDECEAKEKGKKPSGVSRENLNRLEAYLSARFGMEVLIREHTHRIDSGTVETLFDCYSKVTKLVKSGNNILFDITHGFRSMPVLLYQSLQYSLSQSERTVEIVYGELPAPNSADGYARDLSKYWEYSELSAAVNVFKSKLDGFRLAKLIAPYWEGGSKAVKRLSETVQTNFSLQIFEVARQIRNALAKYPADAPVWLNEIKAFLENIQSLVEEDAKPKSLYRYSQFLFEHQMNVQAVITLQIAVESSIVQKYGSPDNLGDYDWWQKCGSPELYKLKGDSWKEMGQPLKNLEAFRNQVAHGGGKDKYTGNFPQASNIANIYKSGKRGVEKLFEVLEKE